MVTVRRFNCPERQLEMGKKIIDNVMHRINSHARKVVPKEKFFVLNLDGRRHLNDWE